MKSESVLIPDNHTVTEFLRGKASQIFDDVSANNKVVIVNKHSRPQTVVISYERYKQLKEKGAEI